jgi:hypothetical protein
MNTVSFEYCGKTHHLSAPSSWNEVTPFQLKAWILAIHADLPESERLRLAVPIFYSIEPALYKKLPEHYRIQLAPAIRFIFEENDLNKWVIESIRPSMFQEYYGPADALSNMTAYEFFKYCEQLYWSYKSKPHPDTLNALVAVLYRQKRKGPVNDDHRCELTDAGVSERAKQISKLPLHVRLSIYFNYEGCRNFITKAHSKAFSGKGGQYKKRGDVTLALAGGPLGDLKQTRQSNLYDFLLHLEELIEREEKLKENS